MFLEAIGAGNTGIYFLNQPIIEEYLEETTINMIAISTKQRGLFERIFGSSSITKKIVNHTKIPLIAFHHK